MSDVMGDSVTDDNLSESVVNDNGTENKGEVVSREHHRRLLAQRKRDQAELAELREFRAEQERLAREKEAAEQTKRGEFDKVLSSIKAENEKLKLELETRDRDSLRAQKYQAVVDSLPGKLANPKYVAFIDIDEVFVDPQSNTIDDSSVKSAADKFLKDHPHLLEAKAGDPVVPANAPREAEKKQGFDSLDEAEAGLRDGLSAILGSTN